MKVLLNCSDIKATGATQVSISTINECKSIPDNEYIIALSNTIANQLNFNEFSQNFRFHVFNYKPFFNSKGRESWRRLREIEYDEKPDVVFSIFGPSVWKPKAPHLMGYAYPYYIYPESPFFKLLSAKKKFVIWLQKQFHRFYLKRNGEYYVCETEDVSNRLVNYINCKKENVFTVTNSFNHYFNRDVSYESKFLPIREINEFRFLSLCSFARHKNLEILNDVVPQLKKYAPELNIKFVLTVDESLFEQKFHESVRPYLINLGRIDAKDCPQLYTETDALFLPTLMECFSASYAEAMKMEMPICTSDLPFARTVCKEAALYFDVESVDDVIEKIMKLINDYELRKELVKNGNSRLKNFNSAKDRANKYIDLCQMIAQKSRRE